MCFVNKDKEWFVASLKNNSLVEKLKNISLIISDIDGCLTNGQAYFSPDGSVVKGFCIQDGFLIAKCNTKNMPHMAFVSGRSDKAAAKRAEALGIPSDLYYSGIDSNKSKAVVEIQTRLSLTKEETLFFGDDILDLETKPVVSLLACPSNALFYVQDNADILLPRSGGNGALRLLLDLILYVQNKHLAQDVIKKSL